MFEINNLSAITSETLANPLVGNPPLYIMDNFYQQPDTVVESIKAIEPSRWKANEMPTYNGIHFDDYRHTFRDQRICPVYEALAAFLKKSAVNKQYILTNMTRFNKHDFNDFNNNYWWPHEDVGKSMTAIVYLNHHQTGGTNLYLPRRPDESSGLQTYEPWRKRDRWHRLKTIEARYNRLVIFPSGTLYHGACVDDETFFNDEFRLNQVMFFT